MKKYLVVYKTVSYFDVEARNKDEAIELLYDASSYDETILEGFHEGFDINKPIMEIVEVTESDSDDEDSDLYDDEDDDY